VVANEFCAVPEGFDHHDELGRAGRCVGGRARMTWETTNERETNCQHNILGSILRRTRGFLH